MFIADAYDNLTNNKKHSMYTQIAIDKKNPNQSKWRISILCQINLVLGAS